MTTIVTTREASLGFSVMLDRVEHDGEEVTIMRDGHAVARILPAPAYTAAAFMARRAESQVIDEGFETDALAALRLLTLDTECICCG